MREFKAFLITIAFLTMIGGLIYLDWWRCGEMFPNAQFACFIGNGK